MNSYPPSPALLALAVLISMLGMPHRGAAQDAAAKPEPAEEHLEKLVKQAPKMHLPKLIAYYKAKLQRIYEAKLKSAPNPEYAEALKTSQEAWQKYYEADMQLGWEETKDGMGRAVYQGERHLYHLRFRMFQLSTSFDEGWPAVPKVQETAPAPVAKP